MVGRGGPVPNKPLTKLVSQRVRGGEPEGVRKHLRRFHRKGAFFSR